MAHLQMPGKKGLENGKPDNMYGKSEVNSKLQLNKMSTGIDQEEFDWVHCLRKSLLERSNKITFNMLLFINRQNKVFY